MSLPTLKILGFCESSPPYQSFVLKHVPAEWILPVVSSAAACVPMLSPQKITVYSKGFKEPSGKHVCEFAWETSTCVTCTSSPSCPQIAPCKWKRQSRLPGGIGRLKLMGVPPGSQALLSQIHCSNTEPLTEPSQPPR